MATKAGSAFGISTLSSSTPSSRASLGRFDVEIPADLQMVGHEADRADENLADAFVVEGLEVVEDVRPEPGLAGRGFALVGERPPLEVRLVGHEPRRREQLPLVRVALVEDARGEAGR